MKTVLVILTDGFEEIETVAPIDLLRRAGAQVTLASCTDSLEVTGKCAVVNVWIDPNEYAPGTKAQTMYK